MLKSLLTSLENLDARTVLGCGLRLRVGFNERDGNDEFSSIGLRTALHLMGVRAGFDDGLIFAKFRSFRCFHFPCELVAGGGYVVSRTLHRHRLGAGCSRMSRWGRRRRPGWW